MSKRFMIILIFILSVVFYSGCSDDKEMLKKIDEGKPVKSIQIEEVQSPVTLRYIGTVTAGEIKKLSFKTSGYVDTIFIKKGQLVKKGDTLAKLDIKDLEFSLKASKAQMNIAKKQYEKSINGATQEDIKKAELSEKKAHDAYKFAADNYKKIKKLFANNVVSQHDFDKIKLELDLRKYELEQAQEMKKHVIKGSRPEDKETLLHQFKKAEVDYLHKKSLIEDAVIKADINGYVVDVLYEEGEMCSAGYPVVVIRSKDEVVKTGITYDDIKRINKDTKVMVYDSKDKVEGKIVTIDSMPDNKTRTYTTEIDIPKGNLTIGSIVDVEYILGMQQGIWVPVHSIIQKGDDYVFVVKGDNAEKRKVEILEVSGRSVMVKGLKNGELVIVEGMKKINDGEKIIVKKDSD